jgi:hypothetical protein
MEARRLMTLATRQIPGLIVAIAALTATACGGCGSHPPPQPMLTPLPQPAPLPPPPPMAAPCDQAQFLATSTAMLARSAAEAPGMKPAEGGAVCGVAAQGQTVTGPMFILEPGYCYTFLGQSLPPAAEMEMLLQFDATSAAGSFLPPTMAGMAGMAQGTVLVSTTPGERINMAEKQSCYQWGFPMPATVKLVLRARSGSGPISAQAFRKRKM